MRSGIELNRKAPTRIRGHLVTTHAELVHRVNMGLLSYVR